MKLMTKELEKKIPALYSQDGKGNEAIVYAHYFIGGCDWFVTEYDREDQLFFGFVNMGNPDFAELGYFSLKELESINHKGLQVERDLYWDKCTLKEAKEKYL